MAKTKGTLRICKKGHQYYKSTDCPTCPLCEAERKPSSGFLSVLSGPARRALEREGIHSSNTLAQYTEAEIMKLHGMGPASLPKLRKALAAESLSFKKKR